MRLSVEDIENNSPHQQQQSEDKNRLDQFVAFINNEFGSDHISQDAHGGAGNRQREIYFSGNQESNDGGNI